eukprot:7774344-Pyramimonas_sp.AAC.1
MPTTSATSLAQYGLLENKQAHNLSENFRALNPGDAGWSLPGAQTQFPNKAHFDKLADAGTLPMGSTLSCSIRSCSFSQKLDISWRSCPVVPHFWSFRPSRAAAHMAALMAV